MIHILNNASLQEDIEKGKFNYSILSFSIEKATEEEVATLIILSTSLSEIEGSEEGILEEYSYLDDYEVYDDIKQWRLINTNILLEELL